MKDLRMQQIEKRVYKDLEEVTKNYRDMIIEEAIPLKSFSEIKNLDFYCAKVVKLKIRNKKYALLLSYRYSEPIH